LNIVLNQRAILVGRILSLLIVFQFCFSAFMKFSHNPKMFEVMAHLGIPNSLVLTIGVLEIVSTLFYAIPATSVLGAILLTGYLGGAICSHLSVGDDIYLQSILGIVIWLALFLRDKRLRNLIPFRK
jgi:hypothetical protein